MDHVNALRRTDTTKGTPLRILSLDGGGVRGYSMLILLHDFMHKVYTESHNGVPPEPDHVPKPCDYFDLIAGTGTGGLIALMLGRLRMNTKECMRVYVQMTRKVFETDKTIVGIPYRSTLFKASMLEEAIRSCVRTYEHDSREWDQDDAEDLPMTPASWDQKRPKTSASEVDSIPGGLRKSTSDQSNSVRFSFEDLNNPGIGNPNAPLEDPRKGRRCKTAVTAVLKGQTERTGTTVFLRSYPSRTQPALEPGCTIWQAGRATCATKLAFKEIRVGTSTFLDEGFGLRNVDHSPTYNPAPEVLEEAILNEWPGQTVGMLVSLGTGKRPASAGSAPQAEWWEGFAGGLGSYAEAKRKLIAKIEGCEKTHKEMFNIHLPKNGIDPKQNYLRLNVEVGVGEFGMNEWNRMAEISNNTQSYLNSPSVKAMLNNGAREMAKIEAMRRPHPPPGHANGHYPHQLQPQISPVPSYPSPLSEAVELPGSDDSLAVRPLSWNKQSYHGVNFQNIHPAHRYSAQPTDDKYTIVSSDEYPEPTSPHADDDRPYRPTSSIVSSVPGSAISSSTVPSSLTSNEAPPIPPKTPMHLRRSMHEYTHNNTQGPTVPPYPRSPSDGSRPRSEAAQPYYNMPPAPVSQNHPSGPGPHNVLPYPDTDGPPPPVNMDRKPTYVRR